MDPRGVRCRTCDGTAAVSRMSKLRKPHPPRAALALKQGRSEPPARRVGMIVSAAPGRKGFQAGTLPGPALTVLVRARPLSLTEQEELAGASLDVLFSVYYDLSAEDLRDSVCGLETG